MYIRIPQVADKNFAKMFKSIYIWFLSPFRNYSTNFQIDEFIYKLIKEIENGAEFWATENGAYVYHIKTKSGVRYNLWGDNRFYAYLSRGGDGYNYDNLWKEQMPSRKCCYDFLQTAKKYCKQPEKPNRVAYTNEMLKGLP